MPQRIAYALQARVWNEFTVCLSLYCFPASLYAHQPCSCVCVCVCVCVCAQAKEGRKRVAR
jgi:hypothetical protein